MVDTAIPEPTISELCRNNEAALLRYAARLTSGDWQQAQDITQEAMVAAWRHSDRLLAEPAAIRPWLFTVVRNLVIDRVRRQARRPAEVGPAALDGVAEPHDPIDKLLTAHVVRDALATLSREHREVLTLLYYQGRTVAEAAQQLGIPAGTVKSRSYYALRALRGTLADAGLGRTL
ncbi:MAG TPA: sigma-70 family RNA polymerase sigma factor [Mycobacteriales bacterium]|nr:sigma-70 family RNA polymerase sigma factor [Mycobacteriales bacterium]